jgi:hypothetical protein
MFEDLYDAISILWSWKWPQACGEITEVDIERIHRSRDTNTFRLAVAYRFDVNGDGPYTGESFWTPAFSQEKRTRQGARKLHRHQQVLIRYRPDDPSINRLDRSVWRDL